MATFEGTIADSILAAAKANQTTIVAAISSAEGGLESLIAAELGKIPLSNPLEEALFTAVKPLIVSELVALEAAEPGSVIFTWALAKLQTWATALGG